MSHIPDLTKKGSVTPIGWLHRDHPFSTGTVPEGFAARLKEFARLWYLTGRAISAGAMGGVHTCEFCQNFLASGSIYVPMRSTLFHAPQMIYHYVEQHAYVPPVEFIKAQSQRIAG